MFDMSAQPAPDEPIKWWETDMDNVQTRPANHPDGFSFLQPHSDKFWNVWLQFTSEQIAQLNFLRWEYTHKPEEVF